MPTSKLLGALALVLFGSGASAHEFWIEPGTHRPEAGSLLSARLMIGHADDKEAYARNPKHLAEFTLVGAESRQALVGRPGDDPAGRVRVDSEGSLVLAYRSKTSYLEMKARKFEAYLVEEGLEAVVAERKRRGESGQAGRELYSRCAKALLRTRGSSAEGFDRRVGMALELVPLRDPFGFVPGGEQEDLAFLLLADGEPLAGAKVHAQSLDHLALAELAGRTDDKGIVRLKLPADGRWVVSAVRMTRATGDSSHEWRSFWASLSFPVAPAPETTKAEKR